MQEEGKQKEGGKEGNQQGEKKTKGRVKGKHMIRLKGEQVKGFSGVRRPKTLTDAHRDEDDAVSNKSRVETPATSMADARKAGRTSTHAKRGKLRVEVGQATFAREALRQDMGGGRGSQERVCAGRVSRRVCMCMWARAQHASERFAFVRRSSSFEGAASEVVPVSIKRLPLRVRDRTREQKFVTA
jgi:hypothetical protein